MGEWRANLDKTLGRLILDTDLDTDDSMYPEVRDGLRCKHLDDSFDWYEKYGAKEVKKERKAQPFVQYNDKEPVMPGSLRRASGPLRRPVLPASARAHRLPPSLA